MKLVYHCVSARDGNIIWLRQIIAAVHDSVCWFIRSFIHISVRNSQKATKHMSIKNKKWDTTKVVSAQKEW